MCKQLISKQPKSEEYKQKGAGKGEDASTLEKTQRFTIWGVGASEGALKEVVYLFGS